MDKENNRCIERKKERKKIIYAKIKVLAEYL